MSEPTSLIVAPDCGDSGHTAIYDPEGKKVALVFKEGYAILFAFAEVMMFLLGKLVDDEPCRLDHHGNCQSHNLENPCSVARARDLLYILKGGN